MFVLELNNFVVAAEDLVAFISRGSEELWEGEPLAGHFVAVVSVDELVVVDLVNSKLTSAWRILRMEAAIKDVH